MVFGNLTEDPFSWHDLSYTFPHWLYDLGIYNVYNLFGWNGLYASTVFLAFILGLAIYLTSSKFSKNPGLSLIFTLIAMYVMKPYLAVRAQLVTFILFVLTIYFIEKFLESKKLKYGLVLLVIPILIANLHLAVWPFYFVLFLPYFAEYLLSSNLFSFNTIIKMKILFYKFIGKNEKIDELNEKIEKNNIIREKSKKNPYKLEIKKIDNVKYLLLIFLIAIFTGLLTPTGASTPYTYLYKTFIGNSTSVINEHLPLTLVQSPEFCFTLIVCFAILIFTDIKIRLKDFLFFAGLLYLSFKTKRQISMFTLICYPIFIKLIANLFERQDKKFAEKLMKFFTNWFGAVITLGFVVILSVYLYKPQVNNKYINETQYPVEASKWIKENLNLSEIRLFNEYNYGSYLLYEGIPVMIDSRCDLYTPEFNTKTGNPKDGTDIFMDVQNVVTLSNGYEKVFEKYDITHVILYKNAKLAVHLNRDSKYNKLYQDNYFVIFERR